ncbi:MAG: exosome complex RNA-binding protein Csl4 [Aigarchaeota archaeon]|nr:exosome complex RNA-binding protein Csl4 [Aigarchaeota archaeon]
MTEKETPRLVVPGEKIGVIEEYIASSGTVEYENGEIGSRTLGRLSINHKTKEARVKPAKPLDSIEPGDEVLCEVEDVQSKLAVVRVLSANGSPLRNPRSAVIVMSSTRGYGFSSSLGIGDLVFARVMSVSEGKIDLSTRPPNCGAVLAFCEFCGALLKRAGNTLRCTRCGEIQSRRTVKNYGNTAMAAQWLGLTASKEPRTSGQSDRRY